MNKRLFILDACTLINLLRIDQDEILYDHLTSFNIKIAETVYQEFNANIFKNGYTAELRDRINRYRTTLSSYIEQNKTIKANISNKLCEEIKAFTLHDKEDGEFYSLLLSLYLSRYEMTQINLYTDDKPATDQFSEYFVFQQLGLLGDSIDLIIYMFCHSDKISEVDLNRFLDNLKSEYNISERVFVKEIEEYRANITNNKSNKNIISILDDIIYGYRSGDNIKLYRAIEKLESYNDKGIRQIIRKNRPHPSSSYLIKKANKIQHTLTQYKLFKIA